MYYLTLCFVGVDGSQETGSSSSWTGWAVSSLTSRIYGGQQGQPEKGEITADREETKGPKQMKTNRAVSSGMTYTLLL